MNDIIRENELLNNSFDFVKADKIQPGAYVQISGDYSGFLDFCRKHNISTIFYKYSFYEREEYTITDRFLENQVENVKERNFCKPWVEDYNKKTLALDFDNPCALAMCASVGAVVVFYEIYNDWLDEGIEKAEDALALFMEQHEEELIEFYDYEKGPSPIDDLRATLLTDKTFRFCTNKRSRSEYMEHFMAKEKNKRFWVLAKGAKNDWERLYQINTIVDRIYNEYRNSCYRLKIQVGEELPAEE